VELTAETVRRWAASPSSVDPLLPPDDSPDFVISRSMGRVVAGLVAAVLPRSVLEFGAGRSSVVFAAALAGTGGGRLTSVEHEPQYSVQAWQEAQRYALIDSALLHARLTLRLGSRGLFHRYVVPAHSLARRAPFDLIFVDGPPGSFGRTSTVLDIAPLVSAGALVVVDDSARPGERSAIARWERALPCTRLVDLPGLARGVTILELARPATARFSSRTFAGSLHDEWLRRRRT
jgi:predicted O-methyltransferase YrrM